MKSNEKPPPLPTTRNACFLPLHECRGFRRRKLVMRLERPNMTCEEFEELSGAFALDAVTPAEREAAEAHLATCPKCTHLLEELHGAVTLLPLSVLQVNLSPALKERILAAIRQESTRSGRQPARL